jgi:D-beta-D-heptose 7-phosphate kinase/D-beta-D-heptose 1-phosphate adenosyltransferase
VTTPPHITTKIFTIDSLLTRLQHWRAIGDRIVFTNGCFDILHPGHISLLSQCREYGEHVVVGLNSDASVSRLKGSSRPVNDQAARAIVLAALESVDAVVVFDQDTPLEIISRIKPDVLVKGGDYQLSQIVGADLVKDYGGLVKIVPLVEGYSTTSILAKQK